MGQNNRDSAALYRVKTIEARAVHIAASRTRGAVSGCNSQWCVISKLPGSFKDAADYGTLLMELCVTQDAYKAAHHGHKLSIQQLRADAAAKHGVHKMETVMPYDAQLRAPRWKRIVLLNIIVKISDA